MRTELVEELGRIVGPRWVRHRSAELVTYAADGLPTHESVPGLVVLPGSKQEVAAVLRLLNLLEVPFVARGAGTGLSGGALAEGNAVLVTLTRMNRILAVWPERRRAVVQPGVINAKLSEAVIGHRSTLSPRPIQPECLHDRRQCRRKCRRPPLLEVRRYDQSCHGAGSGADGWEFHPVGLTAWRPLGPGHRRSLRRERRNVWRSGRDHGSPGGNSPPGTHDICRLSGAALLPAKPSQRSSPPASSRRRSK